MEKPNKIKYVIKERDNLQSIAKSCGVTVADLLKDNIHISMSKLSAGDVIYVSNALSERQRQTKSYFGRNIRRNRSEARPAQALIMEDEQIMLIMRKIFSQHIGFTRMVIMAISDDLASLQSTIARLLQTAENLGRFMGKFFGESEGDKIERLFDEHIVLGGELITAIKDDDMTAFKRLEDAWYKNAYDIALELSKLSENYSEEQVREMMYRHLDLTTKEAQSYINGQFEESIKYYDEAEREGLALADYLTVGIEQKTKHY